MLQDISMAVYDQYLALCPGLSDLPSPESFKLVFFSLRLVSKACCSEFQTVENGWPEIFSLMSEEGVGGY